MSVSNFDNSKSDTSHILLEVSGGISEKMNNEYMLNVKANLITAVILKPKICCPVKVGISNYWKLHGKVCEM